MVKNRIADWTEIRAAGAGQAGQQYGWSLCFRSVRLTDCKRSDYSEDDQRQTGISNRHEM